MVVFFKQRTLQPIANNSRQYDHPGGTNPYLAPWGTTEPQGGDRAKIYEWIRDPKLTSDGSFHEVTGKIGDVYLLHPLLLHSASRNVRRNVRIITNAAVSLKEPFNFKRADPKDYSLVELKTMRDLGRPEGMPEWKITRDRALLKIDNVCWPTALLLWGRRAHCLARCLLLSQRKLDKLGLERERLNSAGIPATTLHGAKPIDNSVYFPS